MHLHPTARRALAGVSALTLLLAACGDDDSSTETEQTTEASEDDAATESTEAEEETTASDPEEATTTTQADAGDPEAVATAEAINLTIDDFAAGWTADEQGDEDEDGTDDIDACFSTVDIEASTVGQAETPTFSAETPDGQGGQVVSMQTVVFDSPDTATTVLSEVATSEFAACAQDALAADSADGAAASLAPTIDDPPLAEESVGLAGAVEIRAEDGSTQQGQVDLHVIRTAEVVSFTFTLDIGATPATGFEQTLTELYTVIAQRQAAEVG